MDKIAIVLRYLQMYSQQAHNLTKGQQFFQDHEFLGELYPAYDAMYDSVIERSIGTGRPVNIQRSNLLASKELPSDSAVSIPGCFKDILDSEKYLCQLIDAQLKVSSEGTRQMLGDMADKSEMRQYKLQQRIKS